MIFVVIIKLIDINRTPQCIASTILTPSLVYSTQAGFNRLSLSYVVEHKYFQHVF